MYFHNRGEHCTNKRYRIEIVVGYGVPFVITLITILADSVAPKCSPLKPGIGDLSCFFTDQWPTFFYFHLPMFVLLVLNAVIFGVTTSKIMAMDRNKRALNLDSGNRSIEMDRYAAEILSFKNNFLKGFVLF